MSTAKKNSHTLNDATAIGGRRQLLQTALVVLIGAVGTLPRARAASCASPDAGDASLRASLHYVESSPNPAQRCTACSFFSDAKGDCGRCMILNAPANVNGHCDSWSARS
jgi:hypothetical protein